ncbi:MAG: M1 family aminopeptidase, partial [Cyclobacteriaceae bacterium]
WNFPDSVLVEKLERIITIQRDFWNDHSDDYYSVTLIPLTDTSQCCSYMGTGLTHSFATFAHDFKGVVQGFEYLFSHELMHHWIGTAIQNDEPEELKYWFSEGFTDYFTQLILLECGFVDHEGFVSNINKMLMDHYASPVREATNQEIRTGFWQDQELEKLPYRRGAIFALYLDGAIKLHSDNKHQLKNVMEELLHICRKENLLLSDSLFLGITQKYLNRDLKEFMKSHVEQGQLIRLSSNSLGSNFTLTYQPVQQFDLGFDFEQSRVTQQVTGVSIDSRAYQAGLRDGQQLTGYSVAFGDVKKPVELTVSSNGAAKIIKYWPLQDKPELGQVPQFVYNPRADLAP